MSEKHTKLTAYVWTDLLKELEALAALQGITTTNALNRAISNEITLTKFRMKGQRIGVIYDDHVSVLAFAPTPKPI